VDSFEVSRRDVLFFASLALVMLAAFGLRFYDLTHRPVHFDEGVIGWFKMNILNACLAPSGADYSFTSFNDSCAAYDRCIASLQPGGNASACDWMRRSFDCPLGYPTGGISRYAHECGASYSYNPDFHGPFEYLFGAWVFKIFGDSDFTLRAPECLFNVLTIALLLPLRRKLGDGATIVAGALLAVSPSMVYYAQRAYMDNFFIFFTLAAVVCAVKYSETKKSLWLYVGAADLALMFTTKETAFIFVAIGLGFAAFEYMISSLRRLKNDREEWLDAARWWVRWGRGYVWSALPVTILFAIIGAILAIGLHDDLVTTGTALLLGVAWFAYLYRKVKNDWRANSAFREHAQEMHAYAYAHGISEGTVAAAVLVFAVIYVFVFSTMFTDPLDAWNGASNGLTFWLSRSTSWEGHFKAPDYYAKLLFRYEPLVLLTAAATMLFSLANASEAVRPAVPDRLTFGGAFSEAAWWLKWAVRFGIKILPGTVGAAVVSFLLAGFIDSMGPLETGIDIFGFKSTIPVGAILRGMSLLALALAIIAFYYAPKLKEDERKNSALAKRTSLLRGVLGRAAANAVSPPLRVTRWCAFWAFGTLAIYSYVPYKTPWLDVHFILPLSIVAGLGTQSLASFLALFHRYLRFLPYAALLALLCFSALAAWKQTYVDYARCPEGADTCLVYVSGLDDYNTMLSKIANETNRMGGTEHAEIALASEETWPLPWSLRHFNVSYAKGPGLSAPLVISSTSNFSDIKQDIRQDYSGPERYEMRPGAVVYLYVRR